MQGVGHLTLDWLGTSFSHGQFRAAGIKGLNLLSPTAEQKVPGRAFAAGQYIATCVVLGRDTMVQANGYKLSPGSRTVDSEPVSAHIYFFSSRLLVEI